MESQGISDSLASSPAVTEFGEWEAHFERQDIPELGLVAVISPLPTSSPATLLRLRSKANPKLLNLTYLGEGRQGMGQAPSRVHRPATERAVDRDSGCPLRFPQTGKMSLSSGT